MEERVAEQEVVNQAPFEEEITDSYAEFESLGDFLDYVEEGVRSFVRIMLERYAKDEFMRYIGAKPYERTEDRQDYRNGSRKRTLRTRFGLIEDLQIPLGRKAGIGYSSILERYRRKDNKIEDIVCEMFLRGVSTRKVNKISQLLWGSELSPAEVSRVQTKESRYGGSPLCCWHYRGWTEGVFGIYPGSEGVPRGMGVSPYPSC